MGFGDGETFATSVGLITEHLLNRFFRHYADKQTDRQTHIAEKRTYSFVKKNTTPVTAIGIDNEA